MAKQQASLGAKEAYLILYNSACCVGWGIVLALALQSLAQGVQEISVGEALANVYAAEGVDKTLTLAQSAALLEIVHAAIGLVRSPVMVTAMQVMSRIVALYAIVNSAKAQTQFGAGIMILSWSLVEVPRYAFYVMALLTGDATKKTPFPLFWLRYSLFAVLYPTGIVGEMTVFLSAAYDENFPSMLSSFYGVVLPIVYVFGSPFMIFNMVMNRKSAFKKRFAKPPPPPKGLVFPMDEKTQTRASTPVNKAIMAAAIGAVDEAAGQAALDAKNWRFGYVKHFKKMMQLQCQSPEAALKIAQAGLDKAYDVFSFVAPDGNAVKFRQAMEPPTSSTSPHGFYTGTIKGHGASNPKVLQVPYKGNMLQGEELKRKVQEWVDYGTIEPSAGHAICQVVDNPSLYLDMSKRYFVLLGAGSAMGPFQVLMALGANVIAIDLNRPGIWKKLLETAKKSSGSITFPLAKEQSACENDDALYEAAGCNLFTDTPKIQDWLLYLYPQESFTVGSYAYLDGALHVQVSLAMDAICRALSEQRPKTSLAYLCTPTDLHLIPQEAHDASEDNFKDYSARLYCILMSTLGNGKFLRKNALPPIKGGANGNEEYYLVNGMSVAQGPNYALAKRMQHWRAIVANSKGCVVSSNIAPATSTVSVVHNRTFAWAYEGMPYFRPYEIFAPETSNAVMSALLLFDLSDPKSIANPKTARSNPNQLFSYNSFHGGNWRCAYQVDSIGEASVLLYFSRIGMPYMLAAGGVVTAVVVGTFFM